MDKSDNDMVAPNNPRLAGARGDPGLYRPSDLENSNFKVFQERIQISRKDLNFKKGFKFQERIQISREDSNFKVFQDRMEASIT